jgi:predicted nucleic acid-binding protein
VTVGELFSLADQFEWKEQKRARLTELIRELVVVEIQAQVIVETWARFHTFLKQNGCSVGDNDVWIAATASAAGALLMTTDKDFAALVAPRWLEWIYIDPPGAKPAG